MGTLLLDLTNFTIAIALVKIWCMLHGLRFSSTVMILTHRECQPWFRIGRVNFQKVVDQESDPKALRHFKHIIETRPITVITKDDTEKGELTADYPLVVSCFDEADYVFYVLPKCWIFELLGVGVNIC